MGSNFSIGDLFTSAVGFLVGGPVGFMASTFAKQTMMSVVDEVIESLPISGVYKEALQTGFHAGMGDIPGAIKNAHEFIDEVGAELGLDPGDVGNMQRSVDEFRDAVEEWMDMALRNIIDQADDNESESGNRTGRSSGRGSEGAGWLWAMAEALGKKLDALASDLERAAQNIDEEDPSTVVDFQLASQRFTIVMNAASTGLKSVGEGMTQATRKNS